MLALRFGWTNFPDKPQLSIDFDPATLGFSQNFLSQIAQTPVAKFPLVTFTQGGYRALGAQTPVIDRTYKSIGGNVAYSQFVGSHTYKIGADYRKIGVNLYNPGSSSGNFQFGRELTSSTGLANGNALNGNAMASFLLGLPNGDFQSTPSTFTLTTPLNIYTNYFGGYVQDDWRVSSKFTLNYGLRLEHETGMREKNNNFTVGFDPHVGQRAFVSRHSRQRRSERRHAGASPLGGLMFAGVNGNPTTQGNPPKVKVSPRVGVVYSLDPKTVLRGGYGLYWAPYNYPAPSPTSNNGNFGQIGFTQQHLVAAAGRHRDSDRDAREPVPERRRAAVGQLAGPAGRRGHRHRASSIRTARAPRVQQYSVDLQRELGGQHGASRSATSARAATICRSAARCDTPVNINQLDPKYLALGATALSTQVPNPFFGIAAAGPFSRQATHRAQPAAAAVPAVRRHQHAAGHRGLEPLQRGGLRAEQASLARLGRTFQLHLQRAEGQPDRRDELLLEPRQHHAA